MIVFRIIGYICQALVILIMCLFGMILMSTMLTVLKSAIAMGLVLTASLMLAWEFRDVELFESC